MKRFFWFCSGADMAILRTWDCSTEHNTYAGIGTTIFGFVANLYLRRFVLWSPPVTYGAQRGRTTMAISFKGARNYPGTPIVAKQGPFSL
jgi:hypothetical protein